MLILFGMTIKDSERAERKRASDRALRLTETARLRDFGISETVVLMLVELIADTAMQSYHQGAIDAIDRTVERIGEQRAHGQRKGKEDAGS